MERFVRSGNSDTRNKNSTVNRGDLRSLADTEKNFGAAQDANKKHLPDIDKRFAGRGGDDVNGIFNEAELERAIIELFEREGYEHLSGDEIHRTTDETLSSAP